jgi:putative SOS response-associated peptidase YedK
MCGRFTQLYSWPELVALYRLTMPPVNLQPSYNICPTDPVDVVLPQDRPLRRFFRRDPLWPSPIVFT